MASTMNLEVEDQMAIISQMYSAAYNQVVPQQGESKPRRKRKKNKGGGGGAAGINITGTKKRKLSAEQLNLLELNFGNEHKLESERKDKLALELGLDPRQVAVWFQNRRARWKNKRLEEEYAKLKSAHETIVLEKSRLESEVLRLNEQLCDAEKQIQRLAERTEAVSSNSPSSSLSMEVIDQPLLEEFMMDSYGGDFFMSEGNYIHSMEWINLYM